MSDLPPGWEWTTIGGISEKPQYGWTTKSSAGGGDVRLLRITDMTSGSVDWSSVPWCVDVPPEPDRYLLRSGDIVVARSGATCGRSYHVSNPPPALFASYLIRLHPIKVLPKYLYWFLQSPTYWRQAEHAKAGMAQPNLNASKITQIQVPVAPLPEQLRIITAIEEHFSRLDGARGLVASASTRVRSFEEAVEARLLTGEWPSAPLSTLAEFVTDGDHRPPKRVARGVPHLTAKHVRNGQLTTDGCTFVSEEGYRQTSARYEPLPGDVIVTCVGTVGEIAVVPEQFQFSADRNLAAIRFGHDSRVRPEWVAAVLRTAPYKRRLRHASGSTAQPHLYLKDLRMVEIPIPSYSYQRDLLGELREVTDRATRLTSSLKLAEQRWKSLRHSVLAAAFAGHLAPQNPDDEPAAQLLEQIQIERAEGIHSNRTRKVETP
jgi:type I restriction enzyme, S subunit